MTESVASVAALISQVGERVLAARKARRFSRRELSERSGVSTRYLVQLEGGEGNISIGLLHKIAIALEVPIEELVRSENALAEEVSQVEAKYKRADAATRARVLSMLDPEHSRCQKAQRVCLIGLRGAGKSTLGARLADGLQVPFIELNTEIQRSAGIPLAEIIALYGEEGYRTLEADTLKQVIASHEQVVMAVAGGLVEQADTFADVLERCYTIWLKAEPAEYMERVQAQGDLRPMAGNPSAMAQLREILTAREVHYRLAEYELNTSDKTVDESFADIVELIDSQRIFTPHTR